MNHSQKVYVAGDVHTNTIEGFWSLAKRGISGVYHAVSTQHLQSYLDEYAFRYNNRDAGGRGMFDAFLSRVRKTAPEGASWPHGSADSRTLPASELGSRSLRGLSVCLAPSKGCYWWPWSGSSSCPLLVPAASGP